MTTILNQKRFVLQVVTLGLIGVLVALAGGALSQIADIDAISGPIALALACLCVAAGLWRMQEWARLTIVVVLWIAIVILPIGYINPFTAINDFGPNPPSAWQLALEVSPWVALGLLVLHVLGRHKHVFTLGALAALAPTTNGVSTSGVSASGVSTEGAAQ